MTLAAQHSLRVTRGEGVTLKWKFGPGAPQELAIPHGEIEGFEVVRSTPRRDGPGAYAESFRLVLLTKKGDAVALEEFGNETQAKLRRRLFKRALRAV
jgi:hypothetical protein